MNSQLIKQIIQEQQSILLPQPHVVRTVWQKLFALQDNTQIIIIKGMRRCGKSTLLHYARLQQKEPHFYFNFDDDRLVEFTVKDFQLLLETLIELLGSAKIAYFDEIQNISGWEVFIRRLHDQGYKIYLTGSNAHLFSRELGTHLTGRYIAMEMYPYSFSEYLAAVHFQFDEARQFTTENKATIKRIFNDYYLTGGIPDYVRFSQHDYLRDLYDGILYRDIMVRYGLTKELALKTLIYYLASNISKELSFNKLKDLLNLSNAATVADYCYYLEASYLCFLVNRYSPSLKRQAHYGKKIYLIDHALAQQVGFRHTEDRGRMLENIVFLELKRRGEEIYYHRDKKECDFLVKRQHQITAAIQVTSHIDDAALRQREIAGLKEAMLQYQLSSGLILTEDTTETIDDNIKVMPIWQWLLESD